MEAKEKDNDAVPKKSPTGASAADWREEQRRVAERAAQDESLNLSFNNLAVEFRTMFRDGKIQELTNGVTLSSEAWLGYENGMGSLVGTESVVLKTGKHFALVNLRKKSYSLWKRPTPGMKVQALTHGLSKREQLVLAYAEMRGTRPILCVLKVGKERALEMPHDLIGEEDWQITSIVLAGKHAVTLSRSQGGSVISYWNYEKERLTQRGDFKYQLKKIAVSSVNSNQMVGAGKGLLRFFEATQKKVLEATTRLLSTKVERENDFVDVKFCGQAVVAVSSQNNLVIVENNTVRYYNKIDHLLKDDLSRYIETYDQTLDQDSKSTSDGLFDQKDSRCKAAGVAPAFQFSGQGVQSNTLAVWPRGIVVATRNGGLLTYFQYEKEPVRIATFPCPDAQNISNITGLSLSADQKHLLVMAEMPIKQCLNAEQQPSVNARQWASVSDVQWGGPIFPKSEDQAPQTPEEAQKRIRYRTELYLLEIKQLKTFANSFTTPMVRLLGSRARNPVGRVTGLAAPAVRGVVLTGHQDATLRMWAHQGSLPRQTQSLSCHDVPLSVAIQPSGLVGAAGFRDGMKAYFVLEESLSVAASWHGKPCQAVVFSRNGNFLAAGNGSCITIVDSLSLNIIYVLSEHPGLVQGLRFSQNDTHLMSYCGAGLCYVWSSDFDQYDCHIPSNVPKGGLHHQTRRAGLPGFGRQFELIAKPHRVLSFDYDDEYDLMVAATSDGRLRIVEKLGREPYMEVGFDSGVEPTTLQIIKQQQILVIGQTDGSVRVVLWPILNVTQVKGVRVAVSLLESLQFKTHEGPITQLEVTPDCKSLLTGGGDGSVFVHTLKDVAAGALDNSLGSVFLEGPIAEAGHKKHRNIGAAYGSVSEYARLDQVGYVLKAEVMERREQVRVLRKRLVTERAELTKKLEQSESNWSSKMATREREVSAALAAEKEAADRAAAGHEAEKALLLQKIEENAVRVRKEKEE